MDWDVAIRRNRDALLRILGMLCAMVHAGSCDTGRMPRAVHRAMLELLRPAESAVRRLIVIVARDMTLPQRAAQPGGMPDFTAFQRSDRDRVPGFRLIDPRKRFAELMQRQVSMGPTPRLSVPGVADVVFAPFEPDDGGRNGRRLHQRLDALAGALKDVTKQARRLVRWQAKPGRRLSPLRPGWPPGYRARSALPVHHILSDCHSLAHYALEPPDTG